jgi:processive 1,2-diacylglycerol beta-glucosyltransferase
MTVDLVVIHSPVGGGHKAAALATAEAARARGLSVEVLDTFEHAPPIFGRAYVAAHLAGQSALPELYGSAYFAADRRDGALEPVRRGWDHLAFAGLVRHVLEMEPRAVVATHHLPLVVLGRARRLGKLAAPVVGVVTDYTAHAVWAERGVDAFAVPCTLAARELASHGVSPGRIAVTGIPVREAFERSPDAEDPATGEPLRVLVTSGGFGVGPVSAIVRSFTRVRGVELTVVCGKARGLVDHVKRQADRRGIAARVLGFERDMAARAAESHVVVGKAGGLTVSEALTAGRPMVIVGAVPGNEALNEAFVVGGGAGVAARPREAGEAVARLREGRLVATMGRRARELVVRHAAANVVDLACTLAKRVERAA